MFGIYEPETPAFGGDAGMDIAHTLFHRDSRHVLAAPGPPLSQVSTVGRPSGPAAAAACAFSSAGVTRERTRLGPRETTVVLVTAPLRGAGLDWFEQGDVWDRVAALRPPPPALRGGPDRAAALTDAVRRLMTARTAALPERSADGPAGGAADSSASVTRRG